MAKFLPGPTVAQVSGSIGGTVFAHNRYGMYMRGRVTPVTSTSAAALAAKARFAVASQQWQGLTAAQKQSWRNWAQTNPITDRLGQSQVLQGNVAYIKLNAVLALAGSAAIQDPPITVAPLPFATLAGTYDIGAGTFDLAFTPTPTGANEALIIRAAVVDSAGINFIENNLRVATVTAGAEAGPVDMDVILASLFGTLIVGQTVHYDVRKVDLLSGQQSGSLKTRGVIITTP